MRKLLATSAIAACMLASPAMAADIIWTGPSDFDDNVSMTFAPVNANTIQFLPDIYNYGPEAHSHGQPMTWSFSLNVNGTNQQVFQQTLTNGDSQDLPALGALSFAGGLVSGITFNCTSCSYNTFHSFYSNTIRLTSIAAGVPEPATWGLMILGFGAVGGAMRRRQAKVRTNVAFA